MNDIKKLLIFILISVVIGYIIGGFIIYINQHKEIYFPDDQNFEKCEIFSDAEKIVFKGTRLYFKQNSDKLAVYYHSNTGSACNSSFFKQLFDELNLSYIFVEYAGYANDSRIPSKKLILQDIRNVNEFMKSSDYSELIYSGYSLGTGPASYHSTLTKPDKILMISPYSSIADLAKLRNTKYPVSIILKEDYDNIEYLKDYDNKVMIMHGSEDTRIPIEFSKKLYDTLSSEKKFVEIKGAEHGDVLDYKEGSDKIKEFIRE